jgi:two-component system nitrate/nitrite response regulator NarL
MTQKTRVMLVDDHALCRSGLTELLEHRGNMDVVVATGDPALVVPLLREHQPDLMVLDLRLAKIDGLSVLRMVRNEGCETPVVILTMSDSEEDMAAALRAGVRGYLLKDMEPDEVIDAIGRAARGEMVVASAMTLKLALILQSGPKVSVMGDLVATLTEREREVLNHVAGGAVTRSLPRLWISATTPSSCTFVTSWTNSTFTPVSRLQFLPMSTAAHQRA